jgi:hypothetical protein
VILSVLSWTFTPSSVMLIMPRGNPLICDCRFPRAVVTPGSEVTKSSAARLVFGSHAVIRCAARSAGPRAQHDEPAGARR